MPGIRFSPTPGFPLLALLSPFLNDDDSSRLVTALVRYHDPLLTIHAKLWHRLRRKQKTHCFESAIVSKLIDNSPCNTIRQIIRVRPPCSLAAPSKAALVPFPNGNGNPQS